MHKILVASLAFLLLVLPAAVRAEAPSATGGETLTLSECIRLAHESQPELR